MNKPEKRHLYYDQQVPQEQLLEAEHAPVTSDQFAGRPPTIEDKYFYDLDRTHSDETGLDLSESPPSLVFSDLKHRPRIEPADSPDSIWQRIYRAFSARFDLNWRP